MLPFADEFRAVHNLEALSDLCASLDLSAACEFHPRRVLRGGLPAAA
jgi:hypothetical protein